MKLFQSDSNKISGVEVNTMYQHKYVEVNTKQEACMSLFQIKTDATKEEDLAKRAGMHIAVVLDISGSMEGSRLKWSKRAIRKLIKHLQAGKDKLHIVLYESRASILVENADLTKKDDLENIVRGIRTRGCTNMCAGIDLGAKAIQNHVNDEDIKGKLMVNRLFVFSDGQVNEGIQSADGIADFVSKVKSQDTIVSAFGIGDGFNEKVMNSVAKNGGGDFYFMENPETITTLMSKAIHGMLDLTASQAKLTIKPLNGFKFVEYYYQNATPSELTLNVGDLHPENTTQFIVKLAYEPLEGNKEAKTISMYHYEFTFLTKEGKEAMIAGFADVEVGSVDPKATFETDVAVAQLCWETAISNKEINEVLESSNNRDKAIELKKALLERLKPYRASDVTGQIDRLITQNEASLKDIENRKNNMNVLKKKMYYQAYKETRNDDWMYDEGCDSDEDAWSDDEIEPQQSYSNNLSFSNNLDYSDDSCDEDGY